MAHLSSRHKAIAALLVKAIGKGTAKSIMVLQVRFSRVLVFGHHPRERFGCAPMGRP